MRKSYYIYIISIISILMQLGVSCKFVSSFDKVDEIYAESVAFDKAEIMIETGKTEILTLTAKPDTVQKVSTVHWSYNAELLTNIVSDNYSIMFTAVKAGTTYITADIGGVNAKCKIVITGSEKPAVQYPYIYASQDYVSIAPDETVTVSAAIFGGTPSDSMSYTWQIDKPSVAQIQQEGNFCRITGISNGFAKITVRHPKALYGYSVLVNVSTNGTALPYLTTEQNVIAINKSENAQATFSVSLKNPSNSVTESETGFTYTVVDKDGNTLIDAPFSIVGNGRSCTITAMKRGDALIRVSHPDAAYHLDILVIVTEVIENAYIEVDKPYITVTGTTAQTISVTLNNITSEYSKDDFIYTFSDDADTYIDYSIFGGETDDDGKGDKIIITGRKTGQVKLTISHPACVAACAVIVTIKDITDESSSSETYITTSQNYIRTSVGADDTIISLVVKNAPENTKDLLKWEVKNQAADGSENDVIELVSYDGYVSRARTAVNRTFLATAQIKPLAAGSAVITVSHPDGIYSTDIIVKVLQKGSSVDVEKTVVLSAQSAFYAIKNGTQIQTQVLISGTNLGTDEDTKITWKSSSNDITVYGNGIEGVITAPQEGSGKKEGTITVSHPDCEYAAAIAVVTYDTQADLEGYKLLYTDTPYITLKPKEMVNVCVQAVGYTDEERKRITWETGENSPFAFTSLDTDVGLIEGTKAGIGRVTATLGNEQVVFSVTVLPQEIELPENPQYLTTAQNVVTLKKIDDTQTIAVSAIGIQGAEAQITWEIDNHAVAELSSTGLTASVTAKKEGKATVTVRHPESENVLSIVIHVGDAHEYHNEDIAYISASVQSIELEAGGENGMFSVRLAHTVSSETEDSGFSFSIKDSNIAELTQTALSNSCIVRPKNPGQTVIQVTHPKALYPLEIIVVVNDVSQGKPFPYLTTSQNVIAIIAGEFANAQVTLVNAQSFTASDWTWTSSDESVVTICANNGDTALLSGIAPGTAKVTVRNTLAAASLELIITCLDSGLVQKSPWINVSTNIIHLATGLSETITAEMIGGSQTSQNAFVWTASAPAQVMLSASGSSAYVRGLSEGISYITIRNTEYPDAYTKTIQVIVEDNIEENCSITVSSKIYKLNPESNESQTIVAQLVGGSEADSADFVWWADDYTLIDVKAVNNEALITPLGKTGQTYLHIKHPKVLVQTDILVLVCEYDTFAFSQTSKKINTGKMAFVEMEVPLTGSETWIEYSSSSPQVCAVSGNSRVCMIAGLKDGSATIRAALTASSGVIAECDMSVIVNNVEKGDPVIDVQSTLITLDQGKSQLISASLGGEQISEVESHNLIWQSSNPAVVSLLQTETGISQGNSAQITAKKAGEAVITITHPSYDVSADIWVKVPEVQEVDISLSQVYMELFKDDGSVTIEALVTNGTSQDYNNITWSAAKVGGVNIISISKAQGRTCNIVPRNPGQTTLRAQLPTGKYADCIVVVNDTAEITLSTKAVHVNPGYEEVVTYKLDPIDAKVEWLAFASSSGGSFGEDAAQFFTFSVNEAANTITIKGLREGSGTIQGFFSSTSGATVTIQVYVEYTYEVSVDPSVISQEPTHDITIGFSVFPTDLNVTVTVSDETKLSIASVSHDKATGEGQVVLTPLGEARNLTFTLTATNPNDLVNTPIVRTKTIHLYYNDYHITPVFDYQSGSFSRYEGGKLYLGDGEDNIFHLTIEEDLADISDITVTYQPGAGSSAHYKTGDDGYIVFEEDNESNDGVRRWRIKHNHDVTDEDTTWYMLEKNLQFEIQEVEYYTDKVVEYVPCRSSALSTDSDGYPLTGGEKIFRCANMKYVDNGHWGGNHNDSWTPNWEWVHTGECLGNIKHYIRSEQKERILSTARLSTFNPNNAIKAWSYQLLIGFNNRWDASQQWAVPINGSYSSAFERYGVKWYKDISGWRGTKNCLYGRTGDSTGPINFEGFKETDASSHTFSNGLFNLGEKTFRTQRIKPIYVTWNPVVISEETLQKNPNFYKPYQQMQRCKGSNLWDQDDRKYADCPAVITHGYALVTTSKDINISERPSGQGEIVISFGSVNGQQIQPIKIPVEVEVRDCEYHCETNWKAKIDSDGNKYWQQTD